MPPDGSIPYSLWIIPHKTEPETDQAPKSTSTGKTERRLH